MRRFMLVLGAASAVLPVSAVMLPETAMAKTHRHHYTSRAHVRTCRHSSGTAGLIAGGAGGAVIGAAAGGGIVGPLIGAVGGAFAGRAIDRTLTAKKRCR